MILIYWEMIVVIGVGRIGRVLWGKMFAYPDCLTVHAKIHLPGTMVEVCNFDPIHNEFVIRHLEVAFNYDRGSSI